MEKKLSEKLVKIFILTFLLGISLLILLNSFKDFNYTLSSLLNILLKNLLPIATALFFLGIVIYGVLIIIVKKRVVCKLKDITIKKINGLHLYELQFEYRKKIFIYNSNDITNIEIGKNYIVIMQNYAIQKIISKTTERANDKESYWASTYMPDGTFEPYNLLIVFYFFGIIFFIEITTILINIILNRLYVVGLIIYLFPLMFYFKIFIFTLKCIINDYKLKKVYRCKDEE